MPIKSIIMIYPRWPSDQPFSLELSYSFTFGICKKRWKY